ncbi:MULTISPECIES: hypothetical protein [unclassified Nostoc]|uniref:hypothetical protein n=1 Tax=unclassified Nostoc TaxID=2593658 RepID=UPI0025AA4735|nr:MULTISPECIES: hypothetical protein [unclassified Nostoc]MDM9581339.1 hypothetical protein [Nostoc sp. GT001]MDZ7948954.1 hypothetical protein [Nostoc sp. EfeVER01]MDZ7992466.1 hypothetical protein [Nostoc sp. EspVER01]
MLSSPQTSSSWTYPKSQKLHKFWFCDLGVSFIVRPYTLRIQIFDWGGRLHEPALVRKGGLTKSHQASKLRSLALVFFPLQVLSYFSQITLQQVAKGSTDLSQCAEPLP